MGKKFRRLFRIEVWSTVGYFALILALLLALLFFRLGTLTKGPAPVEITAYNEAASISQIIHNPLNAPHKLVELAATKIINRPSVFALRASSAVFGILAALSFYFILRHWHTRRMATLGTLLFVTSSWFLHIARLGTPQASQWLLLGLVAYGVWIIQTTRYDAALVAGSWLLAMSFYTPGLIWFVVGIGTWQRKRLKQLFQEASWVPRAAAISLLIILTAPLWLGFFQTPSLILNWLGLAQPLPSPASVSRNIVRLPLQFLVRGPNNPTLWLSRLPILDLFTSAMLLLGAYAYFFKLKLDRTKLILGAMTISAVLIGLGGLVDVTILLPFIYILVAAGITLIAQQWFTVFPRNPWARSIGLGLVLIVTSLTVYYHISSYFIAWPGASATKEAFSALP